MNGDVGFRDETALQFIVRQLRGITEAKVLFVGHHPEFEDEFISILLALDISVSSDRTEELVPAPHRSPGAGANLWHSTKRTCPTQYRTLSNPRILVDNETIGGRSQRQVRHKKRSRPENEQIQVQHHTGFSFCSRM